jgi:hypothetical protein
MAPAAPLEGLIKGKQAAPRRSPSEAPGRPLAGAVLSLEGDCYRFERDFQCTRYATINVLGTFAEVATTSAMAKRLDV